MDRFIEELEQRILRLYRTELSYKVLGNEHGESNARNRKQELQSILRLFKEIRKGGEK